MPRIKHPPLGVDLTASPQKNTPVAEARATASAGLVFARFRTVFARTISGFIAVWRAPAARRRIRSRERTVSAIQLYRLHCYRMDVNVVVVTCAIAAAALAGVGIVTGRSARSTTLLPVMSGIAALFFTLCAIDTFLATQHSYLIVIVVFPLAILELGAASRAKKQHLSGAGALAIFLANIADHVPNAVSISLTVVALVMLGAIGTAYHVARRTAAPGTAVRGHATVGEFLTALTAISILLTAPPTSFVQAIFVVSIWTVVTMALTSWVVWRYDLASNDPVPTGTKHTAALSIGDSISIDNPEGPQGEPSNVTSEGRQSERERHVRLPTFFVPKRTMPVRPRWVIHRRCAFA